MSTTAAALVPIVVVAVAFDVYCLVELARTPVRRLPKWGWALVILLLSAPLGGVLYLTLGRAPA